MFCIRRYGSASLSGAWIACSLCSFCWMQRSPRNDLTIAGRNTEHLLTTEGYETESYHGGLLKCWSHISIFTLYEHIFGHLGKHTCRAYFLWMCNVWSSGHRNVRKDIDRFEAMNAARVPTAQCAACESLFLNWKIWTAWVMVVLCWQPLAGMEINMQIMADNTASRAPTCWQVQRAVER